jgi:shikimate kinase
MRLVGVASACASATVVNAIATGKGAAFGLELRVSATVELSRRFRGIRGKVEGGRESPKLIEACVKRVLRWLGAEEFGARAQTTSTIPVAVGLSSSSAAANAVVLATCAALSERPRIREILELGVNAAFDAGVTLTGALDDAAASLFGQGVITDNVKRRVLKRFRVPERLRVAILIPPSKLYTTSLSKKNFASIREGVEEAHRLALSGEVWSAMVLNGLLYTHALNQDPSPALEALRAGALGAGLTGTGPATVAIGDADAVIETLKLWRRKPGRVILTTPAKTGGRVEEREF